MPRPIFALIDPNAMAANLRVVREASKQQRIWSVIKANAYGHGIEAAVRGCSEADGLAMLDFSEAIRAREAGWQKPILMLEGAFDASDLRQAQKLSLSLVVHSAAGLRALERFCEDHPHLSGFVAIWLKINTGMNRLGFNLGEWQDALQIAVRLREKGEVTEIGVMSHFARADDDQGISQAMSRWQVAHDMAKELGITSTCLANSAAVLRYAGAGADWCRAGIALYGASPFSWGSSIEGRQSAARLSPSMGLYSELIAIREVSAGEEIGYGGEFVASSPMRVGIVACGYADGYPRLARTGTPVLVENIRCPLVGRVSMDMLAIDLTPHPLAGLGSPVELWGKRLRIDEVAASAGTIGYELMCALAGRVPTSEGALLG